MNGKEKREKTPKLVITFSTTSAAIAMESVCEKGLGRIIPVPQSISAGCGLAWSAEPGQRDKLLAVMRENGIKYQTVTVVYMY